MRGVEAAPLVYVIAAVSIVIALSILVLMGKSVKAGVKGATETLNKSVVGTARKIAKEIGETLGEEEIIQVLGVDKSSKKITMGIFNWKNGVNISLEVSEKNILENLKIARSTSGRNGTLACLTIDLDGDGLKDDLKCEYLANFSLTSGVVYVKLLDSSGGIISEHKYLY